MGREGGAKKQRGGMGDLPAVDEEEKGERRGHIPLCPGIPAAAAGLRRYGRVAVSRAAAQTALVWKSRVGSHLSRAASFVEGHEGRKGRTGSTAAHQPSALLLLMKDRPRHRSTTRTAVVCNSAIGQTRRRKTKSGQGGIGGGALLTSLAVKGRRRGSRERHVKAHVLPEPRHR